MIDKLVAFVLPLVFIFVLVSYIFFMPDWLRESIDWLLMKLFDLCFGAIEFLERLLAIATLLLHFLGKLATLSLLAGALAIFANEAIAIFGFEKFLSGQQYQAWLALFTQPYTWAAATTIVAATVAIANLRKLDLDFQDFMEKQHERFEKKLAERKVKVIDLANTSVNRIR